MIDDNFLVLGIEALGYLYVILACLY